MKRDRLYHNDDIELLIEDGSYVIVKKKPKLKIVQRSLEKDIKLIQTKETVKSFMPRFNMKYAVFDCPSMDGKLLFFSTDGDPLRYCCGKHELYERDFEELVNIATKEYNAKSWIYGMAQRDYAPETGYILMSKKKTFPTMVKDDFSYKMDVETNNPKIKFHYYRPCKRPKHYEIDDVICEHYNIDPEHMIRLYTNLNFAGDYAYIELDSWNVIPGCAYAKG